MSHVEEPSLYNFTIIFIISYYCTTIRSACKDSQNTAAYDKIKSVLFDNQMKLGSKNSFSDIQGMRQQRKAEVRSSVIRCLFGNAG